LIPDTAYTSEESEYRLRNRRAGLIPGSSRTIRIPSFAYHGMMPRPISPAWAHARAAITVCCRNPNGNMPADPARRHGIGAGIKFLPRRQITKNIASAVTFGEKRPYRSKASGRT